MEKFKVKRMISKNLWIPIVSAGAAVMTIAVFIAWAIEGSGAFSFWEGMLFAMIPYIILNVCISGAEYFFWDVLTEVEVDGETITIRRFLKKDRVLNVNDLDGYRVDDIYTGSMDSKDYRRIIILFDGRAQKISEMSHTNVSELESYLKDRVPCRDTHYDFTRKKENFAGSFYFEKLVLFFMAIDILAVILLAIDIFGNGGFGYTSAWIGFLYPLFLGFRLALAGGPTGIVENLKKYTPFSRVTYFCVMAFIYMMVDNYIGSFHASNNHGRAVMLIGTILVIFLMGKLFRFFIFNEEHEKGIWKLGGALAYGLALYFLVWYASPSAGMICTAQEPTEKDIYRYEMSVSRSSGRYGSTSYRIKVSDVEDDFIYYSMPRNLFYEIIDVENCKMLIYKSFLGYEVHRLVPSNDPHIYDTMEFEDYIDYNFYNVTDDGIDVPEGNLNSVE